jgi:ferritin-like metal-binding protein YciE
MPFATMEDLFVEELKDLYSAEKQLVKALPKAARAAYGETLADAFEEHLEETLRHVDRLEEIFLMLDMSPRTKPCKGMAGLIEEVEETIDEEGSEALCDAALIAAAQRIEHYEIAAYGALIRFAEMLDLSRAVRLLEETLEEELAADETLTEISNSEVMAESMARDEDDDDSDDEEEFEDDEKQQDAEEVEYSRQ